MKRILLTGMKGQIGWELKRTLATLGQVHSYDKEGINLLDPDSIRNAIRDIKPHVIVNAGAYTAVDKAETEEKAAFAVNAHAPLVIAEEAKKLKSLLIHFSTDYVFDGRASAPYKEEDVTAPLNVYGRTKLQGEKAIEGIGGLYLILRTSWVYGMRGKNFLLTMLRLAKEKETLKIVSDQIGSPNWSRMLAEASAQLTISFLKNPQEDLSGVYHLSSSGEIPWSGFAEAIFDEYQKSNPSFKKPKIIEIPSSEYPTPAKRPYYSVLDSRKLADRFSIILPDWRDALRLCLESVVCNTN